MIINVLNFDVDEKFGLNQIIYILHSFAPMPFTKTEASVLLKAITVRVTKQWELLKAKRNQKIIQHQGQWFGKIMLNMMGIVCSCVTETI